MLSRDKTDGRNSQVVGLLDIGTSKVACIIAALDPPERQGEGRRIRVLGVGHLRSRGLKAGVITDLAEAEATVRAAIAQAERTARLTLEEVFVSVSCGRLQSSNFSASVDITGGVVRADDIDRLMAGGHAFAEREGRTLIHLNRVGFRVDGAAGCHDPRGMAASRLSADMHTVAADEAPVRNLMLRQTQLFNLTGHPAISLPCGRTSDGLPCGLQLVGTRRQTAALLRVALACEAYLNLCGGKTTRAGFPCPLV